MAKRLSKEERQLKTWHEDIMLFWVLLCKNCGTQHEIGNIIPVAITCSCGKTIFKKGIPDKRSCEVVYEKNSND